MGIRNVLAVYSEWAGKVPKTPFAILVYMAATSMDSDDEPWFGRGHEHLAVNALGRHGNVTRADIKAVERAMTDLLAAKAVTTIRRASVRRTGSATAAYRINISRNDAPRIPGDEDSLDQQRLPKNGNDAPRNSDSRPPKNGTTPPGNRGTEEQLGGFEEQGGASSSSGPRHTNGTGTDATAAAAADPTIGESPKPRGNRAIAVGVVLTRTDATDDEATAVVNRIDQAKQPRNLVGLVRAIAAAGELDDWLADVRAEHAERSRPPEIDGATERKWLATLSRCDHGQAGGWVPRAKHGTPSCPSCRRTAEDDMATYKREVFGRMLNEDIQRPPALAARQEGGPGNTRTGNGANGHHNGRNVPGNVWRGPYREAVNPDGSRDMSQYRKPL